MKICYIAWGSLIWDWDISTFKPKFKPEFKLNWKRDLKMKLPIEFARKSQDGRITLVIDTINGSEIPIWYSECPFKNLNNAIRALRKREKTTVNNIGYFGSFYDTSTSKVVYIHRNYNLTDRYLPELEKFLARNDFDTCIWTDLAPNIAVTRPFKLNYDAVCKYLIYEAPLLYDEEHYKNRIQKYINNAYNLGVRTILIAELLKRRKL